MAWPGAPGAGTLVFGGWADLGGLAVLQLSARIQIEGFAQGLDLYYLDNASYPSTSAGLAALVQKPNDAGRWNGPYMKDNLFRTILGASPTPTRFRARTACSMIWPHSELMGARAALSAIGVAISNALRQRAFRRLGQYRR